MKLRHKASTVFYAALNSSRRANLNDQSKCCYQMKSCISMQIINQKLKRHQREICSFPLDVCLILISFSCKKASSRGLSFKVNTGCFDTPGGLRNSMFFKHGRKQSEERRAGLTLLVRFRSSGSCLSQSLELPSRTSPEEHKWCGRSGEMQHREVSLGQSFFVFLSNYR